MLGLVDGVSALRFFAKSPLSVRTIHVFTGHRRSQKPEETTKNTIPATAPAQPIGRSSRPVVTVSMTAKTTR